MKGLSAPEYTLSDGLNVSKGVAFTRKFLQYDFLSPSLPVIGSVPKLTVPFPARNAITSAWMPRLNT